MGSRAVDPALGPEEERDICPHPPSPARPKFPTLNPDEPAQLVLKPGRLVGSRGKEECASGGGGRECGAGHTVIEAHRPPRWEYIW